MACPKCPHPDSDHIQRPPPTVPFCTKCQTWCLDPRPKAVWRGVKT